MYECVTGSQPFPGDSLEKQIGGHIGLPPPTASHRHRDVPVRLDAVIAKGMAKNPAERYATTREMAQAAKAAVAYQPAAPTHITPTPPVYFDPPYPNNPYPNPYPDPRAQRAGFVTHNPGVTAPGRAPSDPTVYAPAPQDPTRYAPAPHGPPQYRPDPIQYPPGPHDPNRPAPKPSRKGLIIGLSTAAAVAAIVAIVAAIALSNSGDQNASSPVSSPGTTPPNPAVNSGPFTGTYTVEFSATTRWNGEPWPNPAPAYTETWRVSSACNANGCVATAAAGDKYPSRSLVFDQIDDRWVAITNSQGTCKEMNGELWNSLSLQSQSGGALSGEFTQTQQNGCLSKRTVTLRRIGEVITSSLPDPATQPARVTTPAEALRGRYHEVLQLNKVHEYDNGVRTDCLRDGKRCMSYFVDLQTGTSRALIFENGQWTRNSVYDADCTTGGRDHITNIGTFPLPQPTQDPIQVLTGHGRIQIAPGGTTKCISVDYEQTFTRTGD
jgi:serine/threonine-protein kinase